MKIENFTKAFGWNHKKEKGYTLIEIMVVLFISTLITTMTLKLVISLYDKYKKLENISMKMNFVDDASLTIARLSNEFMIDKIIFNEDINGRNSSIKIIYFQDVNNDKLKKEKIIRLNNKKELILESRNDTGLNFILKNVEEFKVIKKINIFYVLIKHATGDTRIQCI
ncbi:type II secretion system protein [Clostridium septicum]|uniref:Type II secretion system GspH family protein n=1 Tax=Clostridium septicum TaxID=1504 RepID=A0A9N7JNU2_CLOSE|nr:type II secretion system protein [Clostridium septicum]AYE35629.1 type II secretion system protein [Clostridium septicum]MDU1313226.1 type II secretion system protein [Clostridium septicum]QAS61016.1 type II secretion system protein [Clostridium septicum]UEC19706.1 type II secretion system GspH family protein [Clostridium septicum]USS02233.1 type II secretion system GspH family protein [Clostridium septicum]